MDIGVYRTTNYPNFTPAQQETLINHGFACPNQHDPLSATFEPPELDPAFSSVLALGVGTSPLIECAARLDEARAVSDWHVSGAKNDRYHLNTLVLLAPAIADDVFMPIRSSAMLSARALDVFERVILLYCPHDTVAAANLVGPNSQRRPCMASAGLAPGSDPRVTAIDISGLIEDRTNSARGALCSYEAMGLIVRLLRGIPPAAAVTPFARISESH